MRSAIFAVAAATAALRAHAGAECLYYDSEGACSVYTKETYPREDGGECVCWWDMGAISRCWKWSTGPINAYSLYAYGTSDRYLGHCLRYV